MGRIFKNPQADSNQFIMPQARVVPLGQFDNLFSTAVTLISAKQYTQALPILLNLEVTDFNNTAVHEMLADTFLNLNQIQLAKEQTRICAELMQNQEQTAPQIKSFEELVKEAGSLEDAQTAYDKFQEQEPSDDNFYEGTNIALKLATLLMASKNYQEAEKLLTAHRDKYIKFLNDHT